MIIYLICMYVYMYLHSHIPAKFFILQDLHLPTPGESQPSFNCVSYPTRHCTSQLIFTQFLCHFQLLISLFLLYWVSPPVWWLESAWLMQRKKQNKIWWLYQANESTRYHIWLNMSRISPDCIMPLTCAFASRSSCKCQGQHVADPTAPGCCLQKWSEWLSYLI